MRIIKRIPTQREQDNATWRSQDRWTREVVRELSRLGYDENHQTIQATDDEPGRVYFTGVGALALTVVVRVVPDQNGRITRVVVGRESMTARQAAAWLRKRAPRDDNRRYL